ncbi:hypothetical protein ANO11243_075030 [Dothideomycetidae sp. 11243]|nr:hypothetical protein ANO11243_075030 [fungal sp. No.11243]
MPPRQAPITSAPPSTPVDLEKFRTLAGLTKGSASNAWRNIRTKMGFTTNTKKDGVDSPSGDKKRSRTDEDSDGTPLKKARGQKAGKSKVTVDELSTDGDSDVSPSKNVRGQNVDKNRNKIDEMDADDEAHQGAEDKGLVVVKGEPQSDL